MKNKLLCIFTTMLSIAPVMHAMEYSGPPDKEPSNKSKKEETVEEVEQAPANMLKMLSKDGKEFFVDTQVAQKSPHLTRAIKFKMQHGQDLIYQSDLSSSGLQALIALLQLQHESPRLTTSDIDKIDDILLSLSEEERGNLSNEALNYFELPIAALHIASTLPKGGNSHDGIKQLIEPITSDKNLQEIIMKYYFLTANKLPKYYPDWNKLSLGFSIQDLINFDKLPSIRNGLLDLYGLNINDFTGWENIPHKETITKLELSNNKISNLPTGIFEGFDNLKEFEIENNQLTDISPEILKLQNLRSLKLNENKISDISSTIFTGLKNLTTVYIAGNLIPPMNRLHIPGVQIYWEYPNPAIRAYPKIQCIK